MLAGSVRGRVEIPARPNGLRRPVAWHSWLRLGAPAEAEARIARVPLADARVRLIDRATKENVSTTVTTDARGEFRIDNVAPSPRFSALATDGQVTLEAVLPEAAGRSEVQVVLNEATTVGAEAARLAEEEGLTPEAGAQLAAYVAALQEERQAEHSAEVPNLSRPEEIQTRARQHLLRAADGALDAALETGERAEAWRAVAAAQIVARHRLKLAKKVRLTPLQGEAIVRALVGKETRTVAPEKLLAALKKAGVKDKEGKPVTTAHLTDALASLQAAFPSLKEVKLEKTPVLVALLLGEQGEGPFQFTTREQMKVPRELGARWRRRTAPPAPSKPWPPAPRTARPLPRTAPPLPRRRRRARLRPQQRVAPLRRTNAPGSDSETGVRPGGDAHSRLAGRSPGAARSSATTAVEPVTSVASPRTTDTSTRSAGSFSRRASPPQVSSLPRQRTTRSMAPAWLRRTRHSSASVRRPHSLCTRRPASLRAGRRPNGFSTSAATSRSRRPSTRRTSTAAWLSG